MYKMIGIGMSGLALVLVLAACGQQGATTPPAATTPSAAHDGMAGMEHGADTAHDASAPYDAQFIDGMIEHHKGAVVMAEQALEQSQNPQIRTLSQTIIAAQNEEIGKMTTWRDQWYPGLAPTGGTGMPMGHMEISDDATRSFDERFAEAMISHHQGAIDMARDAQAKAEHQEIKDLAAQIITAQEAEIAQMRQY